MSRRPHSPEPLLHDLIDAKVTFHVEHTDRPGQPPFLRCRIAHTPDNLDRAATVLRRYGLRRNGAQLGRGDWRYHTNAPYTFVITGRPRPRIATHWRPPVRTSELER